MMVKFKNISWKGTRFTPNDLKYHYVGPTVGYHLVEKAQRGSIRTQHKLPQIRVILLQPFFCPSILLYRHYYQSFVPVINYLIKIQHNSLFSFFMTEDVMTIWIELAPTTFERGRKSKKFIRAKGKLGKSPVAPV